MTLRRIVLLASALLLTTAAHGAENWQALSFTTTPQNLPKVIAATDKFMASEAGKSMPGTLSIMASTVDGADPATNSFITSMPSLAAREQWIASLQDNADWIALRDTVAGLAELGATSRMIFVQNWGESTDTDRVWHLFGLAVSDAAAYQKALETLMASETGKNFPGSLYLSSVAASGMSSVTHVVSVGYASEAEGEKWNEVMGPSADWAAFQKTIDPISELQGTWVLNTLQTWGAPPASQ